MATIKDVAKLAGVSSATVSRVLNEADKVSPKTKERIDKAIVTLDFRPNANARALVKQTNNVIGVVISQLASPFFAKMVSSIEYAAKKKNFNVIISTGSLVADKELQAIQSLRAQGCQAIVVNSKVLADDVLIDLAKSIPGFVLINKFIEEIADRCVWFDNIRGGFIMAKYILSLGHTDIAILSTKHNIHDASRRLKGIKRAFFEHKIKLKKDNIYYASPDYIGGKKAVEELIDKGQKVTAILCYNDGMATGAISALTEKNYLIPEDISIVGFDDVFLAQYCMPKLTTIKYPIDIMAVKATELALSLIDKKSQGSNFIKDFKYSPYLVKRDSTVKR